MQNSKNIDLETRLSVSRKTVALAMISLSGLLPGACATKHDAPPAITEADLGPVDPADLDQPKSIQEFRRVMRAKALQPAQAATAKSPLSQLPPPPGVDAARLAPLTAAEIEANPNISKPLEDAVHELAGKVSLPKAADQEVDETAKEEALRLYISGRSALLAGELAQAQSLLTEAAGKDPGEAAVWRELGEAQLKLGRKALATSSFTQAARRGLDDARVWLLLGKDAAQKSDLPKAGGYLSRARLAPDLHADSAVPFVVEAELGAVLAQLGYLTAAAEALGNVTRLPESFSENTAYRTELGEVYRRRGEMLEQSGDLLMRLGKNKEALELYDSASMLPSLDPGSSLLRLIYASALQDEPRKGAEALIESILDSDGWIEDRQLLLIRYLAANTSTGPALSRAFQTMPQDLATAPTPTIESRLTRACAASDASGATILRAYLKDHPEDAEVAADLISLASRTGSSEAKEVLAIAELSPSSAVRLAEVVMSQGRNLTTCQVEIERGARSPGQIATASWLDLRQGHIDKAQKLSRTIDPSKAADPKARAILLGVQLRVALESGDLAGARAIVAALKEQKDLPFSVRASSLLDAGEAPFVAEEAKVLSIETLPPEIDERIGTAEILARAGRAKDAETILNAVLEQDRFNERAYQALLTMYMPGGPLRDDVKIAEISRRLRDAIPSSRVIRWLAAGELAQRQLWPQVEAAIISLSEETTPDPGMIEQLLLSWERQTTGDAESKAAVLARAESWLRGKLTEYPDSIYLGAALARILELQGRASDAEAALAAILEKYPIASIARQREQMLRTSLKNPELANTLALKRLSHMPRSVDETLELAELQAASNRTDLAAQVILEGLPAGAPMSGRQRERIVAILNQQIAVALKDDTGAAVAPALEIFDRVLAAGVDLPKQSHEARLLLMAGYAPQNIDALVKAAELSSTLYPDGSTLVIARTADRLTKSAAPGGAPRFLRECMPWIAQPTTELYKYLVFLTSRYGDMNDIRAFAVLMEDPSRAEVVKELMELSSSPGDEMPATQKGKITQVIYLLANSATIQNRPDFAEQIYRLILERDPNHVMSCNNLAYHIVEAGGSLDEADRLLSIAYAAQPDTASILDSYGWLKYKQGKLQDEKDAAGHVTHPGALSLLFRATEARDAQDNAVIIDHYGDALWAAGEHQKARDQWEMARVAAKRFIDEMAARRVGRNQADDDDEFKAQTAEFRTVVTNTDLKLKAAEAGQAPPIAKQSTAAAPTAP